MDDGGLVERVSVSFSEGVGVSTGDLFQAFHSKGGVELGVPGGGVGGNGGNANVPAWALEASLRAVRATAATRIQAMARGVTARKLARARRAAVSTVQRNARRAAAARNRRRLAAPPPPPFEMYNRGVARRRGAARARAPRSG